MNSVENNCKVFFNLSYRHISMLQFPFKNNLDAISSSSYVLEIYIEIIDEQNQYLTFRALNKTVYLASSFANRNYEWHFQMVFLEKKFKNKTICSSYKTPLRNLSILPKIHIEYFLDLHLHVNCQA